MTLAVFHQNRHVDMSDAKEAMRAAAAARRTELEAGADSCKKVIRLEPEHVTKQENTRRDPRSSKTHKIDNVTTSEKRATSHKFEQNAYSTQVQS